MEWKGRRKKRREFQRVSKNDGDPGIIGERERDTCIYRNSRIINRSRKFRTFISILFSELKFSFLVFTVVLESSDDRSPFGKIAGCYLDFSPVIPRNDSSLPPSPPLARCAGKRITKATAVVLSPVPGGGSQCQSKRSRIGRYTSG